MGDPIEAFDYTFGIEEEFFLVHAGSRSLADEVPPSMISACRRRLGAAVVPELLRSQVELVSPVFREHAEAAATMSRLRREVAEIAAAKSLRMVAAGTAPIAAWGEQRESRQRRYRALMDEFGIVGRRNVLCGLHVHVAVPDGVDRVKLMTRVMPALPLFLALSTSSPFWNREATGLMSYRQAAYDEWPRTGIPDAFADEAEYAEFVRRLVAGGAARDASYLWWAIRPALRYPTLELRICDACTRLEDSLAIAALYRCLVRLHVRRPELGAAWTPFTRRLIDENRWRAKRFGIDATMLALDGGEPVTARAAIGALLDQLAEDAEALGAADALARVRRILVEGTSAHVQLALYEAKRRRGESEAESLRFVVDWLAAESYCAARTAAPVQAPGRQSGPRVPPDGAAARIDAAPASGGLR